MNVGMKVEMNVNVLVGEVVNNSLPKLNYNKVLFVEPFLIPTPHSWGFVFYRVIFCKFGMR